MKGKTFKDTGVLLSNVVHPNIENKLFLKNKALIDKEVAEAAELETLFQEIKDYVQNRNSHLLKDDFAKAIIDNMPKDLQNIFDYTGMINNDAGMKFEAEVANIVSSVFKQVEGQYPDYSKIEMGSKLANAGIGVTIAYPELSEIFGEKFVQKALQSIVQPIKNSAGSDQLFELRGQSGKIDVQAPTKASTVLNYGANYKLQRFYELLSGSSFTAKNYISTESTRRVNVKLGDTSSFRVYMATLAFSNPELNLDEKKKIFYAVKNTKSNIAKQHNYHIRFTYELIGPGLYYNGVLLGECKFLIVNERNGSGIRVFSTKQLIYNINYLNSKMKSIPEGPIHYSLAFENN